MVTLNLASLVWIALNTVGLIWGIRVSKKFRKAYIDVQSYREPGYEGILFQAKQNRRLALAATGCIFVFWVAGIVSLFAHPGEIIVIQVIQYALIVGDVLAVLIVYFLDSGWDRLRAIVGGRRDTDRTAGEN